MNPNQRPPQRPTAQLGYMTPQQYANALSQYMSYIQLTQDPQTLQQVAQLQQLQQQNLQVRPGTLTPGFPGSVASTPSARPRAIVPSNSITPAVRPLMPPPSSVRPSPPSECPILSIMEDLYE